jgi:hypothetical protein
MRPFGLRRALGGGIPDSPMTPVIGGINTATPGRADSHPTHVPPGSYVVSAEDVAHIGDGNTAAGLQLLGKMFLPLQAQGGQQISMMGQSAPYGGGGAPYGAQMPHLATSAMRPPRAPPPYMPQQPKIEAQGGGVPSDGKPGTPINISGGEFVIPPNEVKRRGRGDIALGHEILDAWVNHLRQEHIQTLKKLPGPAQ